MICKKIIRKKYDMESDVFQELRDRKVLGHIHLFPYFRAYIVNTLFSNIEYIGYFFGSIVD